MTEMIEIQRLKPHPRNPRLDGDKSKATVERLARLMKERGFDEAHALIVRPHKGAFQIVSGHRRARAAKRAALTAVPCWVRDMSDDEAHMLLRDENIQDGLHPIEEGKHQIDSGLTQRDYATRIGANRNTLKTKVQAAKVCAGINETVPLTLAEVDRHWRALAALHAAGDWLWPLWAPRLLAKGWTVEKTNEIVARAGKVRRPPAWADARRIADSLQAAAVRPGEVREMEALVTSIKEDALREEVIQALTRAQPASLPDVRRVVEAMMPMSLAAHGDGAPDVTHPDQAPASPPPVDPSPALPPGDGDKDEEGEDKGSGKSEIEDAPAGSARAPSAAPGPVASSNPSDTRPVHDADAPDPRVAPSEDVVPLEDNDEDPLAIPPFLRRPVGADGPGHVEQTGATEQEAGHPANEEAGGEPTPRGGRTSFPEQIEHEEGTPAAMTPEERDLSCVMAFLRTATPSLSPQRVIDVIPAGSRSELAELAQSQHKWLGELLHLLDKTIPRARRALVGAEV